VKAKEFAKMWEDDPTLETAAKIGTIFLRECAELAKVRNAKSDAAMIAIFEEQNRKWKAFARRVDGIREDGFEGILKEETPAVYMAWKISKPYTPPNKANGADGQSG